ncbi:MAG: hypothetical protein Fur0022_26920 [Anaerolineales bacterium]
MLAQADLFFTLADPPFKELRKKQRDRLAELEEPIYTQKRPVILVFEGWDASGKGKVIRELTRSLDPRGFKVYQTQAPRTLEKKMPWLWRFWMQIPRRGQIAIFDRSWYGRVLVERVEGLTPIPDWIRAYEEINNFERTLTADRTIFLKFWFHISEREQLARFIRLSKDPLTAWEISAEDWEHHRKYKEYEAAVKDMLENTHTPYAPWAVIPATDLNACIYQVYCVLINTLEKQLGIDLTRWDDVKKFALPSEKATAKPAPASEKKKGKKAEKPHA